MKQDIIYKYFFFLFALIPFSILLGTGVSAINIILIAISFLIYLFYIKDWKWLKKTEIKLLFLLYLYLIFNSFISLDFEMGLARNFGFLRFILFFAAFNYFFYNYKNFNKVILIWFVVIILVVFDIYFEAITGKNLLGYGNSDRIHSFFRDEQKVGGYVFCFYLLILGYFLDIYKFQSKKKNYLVLIVSLLFLFSIIATGERSNGLKALTAFIIFFLFSKNFLVKEKFFCAISVILIMSIVYSNSEFIKLRFGKQLFWKIQSLSYVIKYFKEDDSSSSTNDYHRALGAIYFQLYETGIGVFKEHKIFGVGNKNFRVKTCSKDSGFVCNTHPHQIYIEFLSEHGIIGTTILLVIFFSLIFKILRKINIRDNNLQLGCVIYLSLFFVPLIPGGAFFNDYVSTLFWINLSFLYAFNKDTNIFK